MKPVNISITGLMLGLPQVAAKYSIISWLHVRNKLIWKIDDLWSPLLREIRGKMDR